MRNYLGNSLNRLIRRYAYVSGEHAVLESKKSEIFTEINRLNAVLADIQRQEQILLAESTQLRQEIDQLSVLDVDDIRAIQAKSRRLGVAHGKFNTELVRFLRLSKRPLKTSEIIQHMATKFDLPMGTPPDREWSRKRVARQLREYRDKGAVIRLDDPLSGREAFWQWTGIMEEQEVPGIEAHSDADCLDSN